MMTAQEFGEAYQNDGYKHTVRYLQRIGAGDADANELAQEAWTRGWERIWQLRDERYVVHWVNTIARRLLLTSFRQLRLLDLSQMNYEPAAAPSFDPAVIDMRRALPKCKPHQRELLEAFLDGHSNHDLATQ